MIILGYFLNAVGTVLGTVITILMWLFIAHAVLSWVSPDPRNPIVNFIYSATNPMLSRVRSKIKPIGMFDLSVIIVLLVLVFLDAFLVNVIKDYAAQLLMARSLG
jgi:YggT family protein